ncbi:carbon starvation CstA family protein [Maledivibacter halophilus]|uniref:Carbon starvation protein n=1 Tax=Maledivibacter halophilus TaxID=36842 RepID=A0A1T5KPN8_9FIRM|nr:carbon starvation protein A [Maledivibacter halophilus]SKC65258.1 carbon starvation protein [Maledivibacter halophilus]
MNSFVLLLISAIVFFIAYVTYGAYLSKKWGIDPSRKTPAHTINDGVDYVPAKAPVLLGHHFSSIAGAGPIVGPISAAIFGWVPVFLWIIVGSIFFGGVHDMGALFASVRHEGKSLGEVIGVTVGKNGKKLFAIFAWLTLLLVVAAFANIVADTFVSVPEAATASVLFIAVAIVFGFFVYRRGVSLGIGSVIGVALLLLSIYLGTLFPLQLGKTAWLFILLAYIFIASVTPVWILLQPRDYLNSFLLYAMLIGGFIGVIFMRPTLQLAPVTSFTIGKATLFPMLFVTVACGAISGFHSLVGSGTTAKQVDNEKDVRLIGYGSMLIEGILAVLAIVTAGYIAGDKLTELLNNGGPVNVFSSGVGNFMTSFGLPFATGKSFVALAISAFALTSLDTATRLARFIFQEFFDTSGEGQPSPMTNRYVSTLITVALGGGLAFKGWQSIWPLFGSANQLLAALALLALGIWLKKSGREYKMAIIPMVFMFAVTLVALIQLMIANLGNILLLLLSVALFILAIVLIIQSQKAFKEIDSVAKE